jgi:hypothetical protein
MDMKEQSRGAGGESMTDSEKSNLKDMPRLLFAIVLENIPEKWGMNVLQLLGRQTSAQVNLA